MKPKKYLLLVVCFFLIPLHGNENNLKQHFLQSDKNLWIGTNSGLYKYNQDDKSWSRAQSHGVTSLFKDEENLWLGTVEGLYSANSKFLDWKKTAVDNIYGRDTIVSVIADEDYVFVASKHGIIRMDKLVEQWETIHSLPNVTIYDMYSDRQYLWVATSEGVHLFDKRLEKWELYTEEQGLLSKNVQRIFYFGENIWFLTDKGFSLFNNKMRTWQSYRFSKDLFGSGVDYLWVSSENILVKTSAGIEQFSGNTWNLISKDTPLEKLTVSSIASMGKNLWFTTDDCVYFYNDEKRQWSSYTSMEGLHDDIQENVVVVGQAIIAYRENSFNVYSTDDDLWESKTILLTTGNGKGENSQWTFFNDDKGMGFSQDEKSVALLGKAFFKLKNKADFTAPLWESITDYIKNSGNALDTVVGENDTIAKYNDYLNFWFKGDLALNVNLGQGRSVKGYFNNTDPLGNLHQGLMYYGGDDWLKRLGFDYTIKTSYFHSSLIDQTYLYGGLLKSEFGKRVGEKKRKRFTSTSWAGHRKTEYIYRNLLFREDNFYTLDVNNIITSSVEVSVDGTIIDPLEYSIERTRGTLTFKNENLLTPDSKIEVVLQYEPELGEKTADLLAVENILVVNDNLSFGVNGMYRGKEMIDAIGTGLDTNHLGSASINAKIDYRSKNGEFLLTAVPEVASSFNDSVLVEKKGMAGKLDLETSYKWLQLKSKNYYLTKNFESMLNDSTQFGKVEIYTDNSLNTIFKNIRFGIGGRYLDGNAGDMTKGSATFLFAKKSIPTVRIDGFFQRENYRQIVKEINKKDSLVALVKDSLNVERIHGRVESQWTVPQKIVDRLKINQLSLGVVYTSDFITENSYVDTATTKELYNHNISAMVKLIPFKSTFIEGKATFRYLQNRVPDEQWGSNYSKIFLPEVVLYMQDFIPGITTYNNFTVEKRDVVVSSDSTSELSKKNLNSTLLISPGIWLDFFNPLVINGGYSFTLEDKTVWSDSAGLQQFNVRRDENPLIYESNTHSYMINPTLDFTNDIRIGNKTEYSQTHIIGRDKSSGVKTTFDGEMAFKGRKRIFSSEFTYGKSIEVLPGTMGIDSIWEKDTTMLPVEYGFMTKWEEKWKPTFRTELQLNLGWNKIDTILYVLKNQRDTLYQKKETHENLLNSISPTILIDGKIERKILKEFRIQYNTGLSFSNGQFPDLGSYEKWWSNKLNLTMKIGKNFQGLFLVNLNYNLDEAILKYDLAELKLITLF